MFLLCWLLSILPEMKEAVPVMLLDAAELLRAHRPVSDFRMPDIQAAVQAVLLGAAAVLILNRRKF